MSNFDHHVHTSRHSPDSVIDPYELIERAKAAGLSGVVITEHDHQWESEELAELSAFGASRDTKVFSGAEISAREGHFLVYGLPDLDEVPPGVTVKELLKVVRAHQGAIVAAHPFRWDQNFNAIMVENGPAFDALELVSNNITHETRSQTERLLGEHPMGRTGSSDGHEPEIVGCYFTEFPGVINTMEEFVKALQARSGRPGNRQGGPLTSGPVAGGRGPVARGQG